VGIKFQNGVLVAEVQDNEVSGGPVTVPMRGEDLMAWAERGCATQGTEPDPSAAAKASMDAMRRLVNLWCCDCDLLDAVNGTRRIVNEWNDAQHPAETPALSTDTPGDEKAARMTNGDLMIDLTHVWCELKKVMDRVERRIEGARNG
jgi:hypothetical protein